MPNSSATMPPTAHGQSVLVNNLELYYEEIGAGEPLLLLHGFGGCRQTWYPFVDALAAHFRLLLVDLRGHGYSTNPDKLFTHRAAAQDVFALLDYLQIDSCAAMGISSGGMVLLHMASAQRQRIAAMVLVSATTHFPEQARKIMRAAAFATMPPQVQAIYQASATRGDEQIQQLIAQFNLLGDNYEDMAFTPAQLSCISARTLVVHGDSDRLFPVDIPLTMCRAIPNASSWIIPGGDHGMIFDAALPFSKRALQFLTAS